MRAHLDALARKLIADAAAQVPITNRSDLAGVHVEQHLNGAVAYVPLKSLRDPRFGKREDASQPYLLHDEAPHQHKR